MLETSILVALLFGLGALSLCGMVIYAASMRAMMPPPMPDIRHLSRGWPTVEDYRQLPSPQQQEMK